MPGHRPSTQAVAWPLLRARECFASFPSPPVRQSGFVKSAIVAPLPVVGPRVRGNVPEVITYRIGGIAAGIGPKLVKSYALQQKNSALFQPYEDSTLRCNI